MTRVLLIRHGQSEWNADGRWQGQADPPLTDLGRQQAWHAARNLGTVDAIVASDLDRASETALIISGQLGVGPLVLEPGLRERDAGEWSGLTRAEIDRDWPGFLDSSSPFRPTGSAPSDREPPADRPAGFGNGPATDGEPATDRPASFGTGPAADAFAPPTAKRHASLGNGPAADASAQPKAERRRPPSWEPDEVLLMRVIAALGRVHDLAPDGEVIAITHGGVVYALESEMGSPFERLANLGGRWIDVGPGGELRRLGDRVVLVDPDELTVPAQL